MTERERCGTCRFFRQSRVISVPSVCRRYPKHIPHVQGDWCGEYQPTPENVESPTTKKGNNG